MCVPEETGSKSFTILAENTRNNFYFYLSLLSLLGLIYFHFLLSKICYSYQGCAKIITPENRTKIIRQGNVTALYRTLLENAIFHTTTLFFCLSFPSLYIQCPFVSFYMCSQWGYSLNARRRHSSVDVA